MGFSCVELKERSGFTETTDKNLTRWLFEQQEGGGTILGESQNLSLLADILESEKATQALLKGASLEQAYRLSFGVTDDFIGYLYKAEEYLEE